MQPFSHRRPTQTFYVALVRPEPSGQFTAQFMYFPHIQATAATEQEAIAKARRDLEEWLASGRLLEVPVDVPEIEIHPSRRLRFRDPNDPLEKEYLEILAQMKKEDLEKTLAEYDQECPGSSSTPTT